MRSMKEQGLTSYFDTSFYVNLLRAEENEATSTVEELNRLGVRHVLSDVLVRELLSNPNTHARDRHLFERIQKFDKAPYCTAESLNWDFLLESGSDRKAVADIFTGLDEMLTLAHSYSAITRRKNTNDEQRQLSEAAKPFLRELGFPDDFSDTERTMKAGVDMLRGFGINLPDGLSTDDPKKLSEQLFGMLSEDEFKNVQNDQKLKSSSTNSDNRTFQVAIGVASDKTRKRLANDFRDTDHMLVFFNHQTQIDYLQIDLVHAKRLKTIKPLHYLVEEGLADRCFSANSLLETVECVKRLASQ